MSEYRNLADVVAQLRGAGLMLDTAKKSNGGVLVGGEVYVESTKSIRCDVSGEKKKQTGAYRLHELRLSDGIWITGAYWLTNGGGDCFKLDLNKTCEGCGTDYPIKDRVCPSCGSKKSKKREVPPEQMEAHKKRMGELRRQAEADAQRIADRAASWADAVWLACREITDINDHDYLVRKKLASAHGARLFEGVDGIMLDGAEKDDYEYLGKFVGALVVPMCDTLGRRRGLQFILSRARHKDWITRRDGLDKSYWPEGIQNDGLMFAVGGAMHGVGLVGEGFATVATLVEASGLPAAVAFDAGGLPKVGEKIWKSRKKRINLLYCADDDWLQKCKPCGKYTTVETETCQHCGQPHTKGNAGVTKAQEAALSTSGAWVKPAFSAARPTNKKGPTDFNDLRVAEGEQTVQAQVMRKLDDLGWGVPPPSGGAPSTGGQGADDPNTPRPEAVSVMALDDVVSRFIHLDDKTGEYVFDTWTREVCKFSKVTKMLPARVRTDDVKDHPHWRARAIYLDQIGFDPAGGDPNIVCNMWAGWPTVPKRGGCDLLLSLLEYQCAQEESVARELYQWVLRWLAYPIQHPGAKMQTAIIMHGPQGTGKGRFFEWGYMPIFGRYGVYLDQDALEDKHGSDWQSCKLFVLADEVLARAEMYHHKNKLKNLVTSRRIRINPKGLIAYEEANHLNIVFLSNEKQPLVLENDDRRYCVIWTPPPMGQDFYDELSAEIENGGVEALHHYLKYEIDLGDFKPWTRPPMTEAKRDLINMSRDSIDRFMRDWQAGDVDGLPFCPCSSSDLYRAYLYYCRANGERMPRPENHFGGHIVKMQGWYKGHKDIIFTDEYGHKDSRRQRVVIPPQDALASGRDKLGNSKDYRKQDGDDVKDWLTPCFFEFRSALRVDP